MHPGAGCVYPPGDICLHININVHYVHTICIATIGWGDVVLSLSTHRVDILYSNYSIAFNGYNALVMKLKTFIGYFIKNY